MACTGLVAYDVGLGFCSSVLRASGVVPGESSEWRHIRPGVLVVGNVSAPLWFVAGNRQLPQRGRRLSSDRDKDLISDLALAGSVPSGWGGGAYLLIGHFLDTK